MPVTHIIPLLGADNKCGRQVEASALYARLRTGVGRHAGKEGLEGGQAAGRGADADDGEAGDGTAGLMRCGVMLIGAMKW